MTRRITMKQSPTFVISLNQREAEMLVEYLNNTYQENSHDNNAFSIELAEELEELLEDIPVPGED